MRAIDEYRGIVGDKVISDIVKMAKNLYGLRVLHINSTYYGGGVAEMLYSLIPLMNDVGVSVDWRILRGTPEFFTITKKFHNAIQGDPINLSDIKKTLYIQNNQDFASYCQIDADCVIIHDPQPLPLIRFYKRKQPWIWRCHVDLSRPNPQLWDYLKGFILRYDRVIVSDCRYMKEDLPMDYSVIHPVIDPLSSKNKEISKDLIMRTLKKYAVPTDKPILTQISRFDKWKDPANVIEMFKLVKARIDCRLVLCGSMAADDPEGIQIYQKILQRANNHVAKRDVILLTVEDNILVNALQRISSVVIQKSIREGFGLTVTEALWKEKPVVASNVGGIPLQMADGETGYLIDPTDIKTGAARVISILENPAEAKRLGTNGREMVLKKFLITRHLYDDLKMLNDLFG
ncbi:MAG: Trehalose synthase [Verrucomicrobia bacterium ADurb.Bin474]|nr:MAG: Trehalose synthase [Verrucomicrobia bacterium ADurb.Bin474]